jgi:hypothetical protein
MRSAAESLAPATVVPTRKSVRVVPLQKIADKHSPQAQAARIRFALRLIRIAYVYQLRERIPRFWDMLFA